MYAVEVASCGIMHMQSFMTVGSCIQVVLKVITTTV
jgi:hypothetical protein